MQLTNCKLNKKYEITGFADTNFIRRFYELGFNIKSEIIVIKKSLLKKSLLLTVDGIEYSVPSNMAKYILVR